MTARPRRLGLRGKSILAASMICLGIGSIALISLQYVIKGLTEGLGANFAEQHVLWHKEKILAPITRELGLAMKLADSVIVKQWSRREDDPMLARLALAELNNYNRHLQGGSYFLAIEASKNFYFNDAAGSYTGKEWRQTLDENDPDDAWYFTSMGSERPFIVNVDSNAALGVTKVWINVPVVDGAERLGVAGTGMDLTRFIEEFVLNTKDGVSAVLIDQGGAIQAHQNPGYIDYNTASKGVAERLTLYRLLEDPVEHEGVRQRLERLAQGDSAVETFFVHLDGRRHLAAASYLAEIGWYNLSLVDLAQVVDFRQFSPLVVLLAASLLIVVVLISMFLNRLLLIPLLRLTESTQAMAAGDYRIALPADRDDEIGQLTRAFKHMAATVRDYMRTLEQKVEERTKALQLSNRRLAESNRQVMDSIHYASMIQSSLLPSPEALQQGLGEYFVIWRPRDVVGGDFYLYRAGGNGFWLGVVDCTGHGVPGAFMTMLAQTALNRAMDESPADPAAALRTANRLVREMLHEGSNQRTLDNGFDMALCRVEPASRRLIFAGARLPLYYTDGDSVVEVKGNSHSIGYRRSKAAFEFTAHTLDLAAERTFYLCSDGYLDQAGGIKGFGFGKRRLMEVIAEAHKRPLAEQAAVFERRLAEYQGGRPQRDDITIIGFRPAAGRQA